MEDPRFKTADSTQPNSLDSGKGRATDEQMSVAQYGLPQNNYPIEDLEVHEQDNGVQTFQAEARSKGGLLSFSRRKAMVVSIAITIVVTLLTGASILLVARKGPNSEQANQTPIKAQDVALKDAEITTLPSELQGSTKSLLVNGDLVTRGELKFSDGNFITLLRTQDVTANQTFTLPNSTGTICLDSNNCGYSSQTGLNQANAAITVLRNQLGQIVVPSVPASSLVNNQTGAVAIQGTTNQVSVTNGNGTITLATPQDLAPISSPTFSSLVLNGNFTVAGTITIPLNCSGNANGGALTTNGSGQVICSDDDDAGGGGTLTTSGGTIGTIPVYTAAQNIENSLISQALGTITITGNGVVTGSLSAASLSLTSALSVPNGGTGQATFVANGVIYGNGVSGLLATAAPTAGQLLIGNGSNIPAFVSISGDVAFSGAGVTTIQANSIALGVDTTGNYVQDISAGNGISVSGAAGEGSTHSLSVVYGSAANTAVQGNTQLTCPSGAGNLTGGGTVITLGTGGSCAALNTVNNPNFTTSVTTPQLIFTGAGSNGTVQIASLGQPTTYTLPDPGGASATICLSSGNCLGGTGGASNAAAYVTVGNDGTLTGERAITAGTNLSSTDGGANSTFTINTVANPTFATSVTTPLLQSSGALSITPGGAMTVGAVGQTALLQGSTTTITSNGATNDIVLTSADQIRLTGFNCTTFTNGGTLTTDASGNISCANDDSSPASTITGTGSANRVALFTGAQTVADSWLLQNGSTLEIDNTRGLSLLGGNFSVTGTGLFTGLITANGGVTVEAGDTFTFNGDAFTDLTGTGLTISSGSLQTTLGTSVDLASAEVTGILPVTNGGTGINGSSAANGTLLIGNGTGYTLATLTQGTGITISNSSGGITVTSTLGTTVDSAEIVDLTVTGADIANDTIALGTKTTGNYQADTVSGNGIGVTGTPGEGWTATLGLSNLTADWSQTAAFDIVLGNASSELRIMESVGGTFYGTLDVGNLTADRSYTFPDYTTGTGTVCLDSGNCVGSGGGVSTVGGTNNRIPVFTGAQTIADGWLLQNGSTLTLDNTRNLSLAGGNLGITGNQTTSGTVTFSALANGFLETNGSGLVSVGTIDLGADTTGNYVATITNGNGITGSSSTEGGTPTIALGPLTANWVQSGAFDTVYDNAGAELQILESAGGTFYGTFDVGDLSGNEAYTFLQGGTVVTSGNVSSFATTAVTAGGGLTGGGTTGALTVNIGAGNGITVNTDDIAVIYGSAANTAVQGNTSITVSPGTNLTGGGSITLGSGGSVTLNVSTSPTFSGNVTAQGGTVSLGVASSATGSLDLYNATSAFAGTVRVASLGQATVYTLPDPGVGAVNICLSTGNCAGAGGGVTGAGTNNRIPKYTATGTTIGDSTLSDDGTNVTTSVDLIIQGGSATLGTLTQAGSLVFHDGDGETITLNLPDVTASYSLLFPAAVGGANQCLKAQDGSGTLFWDNCLGGGGGGGITSVDGQTGPAVTINNASGAANAITIDDAAADGTTKGIAAFNATNFTAASGIVNTVQGISTAATPSFAGLTLTGNLNMNANTIQGTTAVIDFTSFDVASNGNITAGTYNSQDIDATANFTGSLTVTGLTTLNGGLTLEAGDTFTFNSDAFTDLTGGGLQVTGNALTIRLDTTAADGATTSSVSGLEIASGELSLIRGCANGEILKWDNTNFEWDCAPDAGGAGVGDDVQVAGADAIGANFIDTTASASVAGVDIVLNTAPLVDEISITLNDASGTLAGIVTANAQTFGGAKTFNGQIIAAAGIDLAAQTLQGTTAVIDFNNFDVSSAGAVTAVGVNAGSGLLQGTGGITISGTTTLSSLTNGFLEVNGSGVVSVGTIDLTTDTAGNYVATITAGNGISGSSSTEGGTPTIALSNLTADWLQSGAFDVSLANANSELKIMESAGATFYAILDVSDLSADQTFTLSEGGTVVTSGNVATHATTGVTAGTGLTGGGTVGVVTLNVASANGGIVANANDIALTLQTAADALSATTSSGSGLEVLSGGLTLLQGCSDGQILKWNETTDAWGCAADAGGSGVGDDVLVNGSSATGANFINTAASGTSTATTWTLTAVNPDTVSVAIGNASNTEAGAVTTGIQTFAGAKTFNGSIIAGAGIDLGTNTLQGTTAAIDFTNFDVTSAGVVTVASTLAVQGASATIGTTSLQGNLVLHDGSGETLTIRSLNQAANRIVDIPIIAANDTFCLATAANCAGLATTTLQQTYNNDADGSNAIIALTTADDSLIFRNPAASGTDSAFLLQADNLATGVITNNFKNVNVTSAGSFDTTAGVLTNYGTYIDNNSTRSAGSNNLTNVGLYVNASGAQTNYAAIFQGGNVGIGTTAPAYLLDVAGSLGVTTLGAADSDVQAVCRDISSRQLVNCDANSARPFLQGGNTFGQTAVLGTNDGFDLQFKTSGNTRLTLTTGGNLQLAQGPTRTIGVSTTATADGAGTDLIVVAGSADGTTAGNVGGSLTLRGGNAAGTGNNNGGELLLQGGTRTGSGVSGSVVIRAQATNSTTAFQVQNTAAIAVLNVDTNNGRVGIGTSAPSSILDVVANSTAIANFQTSSDSTSASILSLKKSRGTAAVPVIVQNDDGLGFLTFNAYDGAAFGGAAAISAAVDGTPGLNDRPGRLIFFTTPDGSTTLTERLRIDSNGNVGIGATSSSARLQVTTSNATAAIFNSGNITAAGNILEIQGSLQRGSTSGTYAAALNLSGSIEPTSGSSNLSYIDISGTINQTGTATGTTRGLYIRPTLTSAPDYRGVDIASNSGFGVFQSGSSAINYFAGNTGFGDSTPAALFTVGTADAFQVNSSGNITTTGTAAVQGASVTVGAAALQGNFVLHDGDGETATFTVDDIAASGIYKIPNTASAADTFCLLTLNNCAGTGNTLQQAYDAGSAGDQVIALDATQDSIVIRNPASSGSDSIYPFTVDQLNTGAFGGAFINSLGTGFALRVDDSSSDTTPFVIDQNGWVGIGTTAPANLLHVMGSTTLERIDNTTSSSDIEFKKARGAVGALTTVQTGDELSYISSRGYDGAAYRIGSAISSVVDGAVSNNNVPTALVFSTNPGGQATPNERLRITSGGTVDIAGVTTVGYNGVTPGANIAQLRVHDSLSVERANNVCAGCAGEISFNRARGTINAKTAASVGDSYGDFLFRAYDGAAYQYGAAFGGVVDNASYGGAIVIQTSTTGGGTLTERLRVDNAGNVGIGDTSPAYLLTVGNGDLFGVNSSGNLLWEGATADAFEFTVTVADPTADRTYTIPNSSAATDTFCLLTLNNCSGTATTLQASYTADVDGSDAVIALTSADGGVIIRDNATPLGTTLFAVQNSAGTSSYLGVTATGVTVAGTISVPGTGASSERFGASATTTGGNSLAVGTSASANSDSTAIGYFASTTAAGATAVGQNATADFNSTALGRNSTATNSGLAVGNGANSGAGNSIAIGTGSSASGDSTAVGHSSSASAAGATALGQSASAGSNSIAIGRSATTTAANQLVVGSGTAAINQGYFGNGVTAATPTVFTLQGTGSSAAGTAGAAFTLKSGAGTTTGAGSSGGILTLQAGDSGGTNIAGAITNISGGRATGNAATGNIVFQYAPVGGSGATLQTLQTACFINGTTGSLSCPGSGGAGSERFGDGATAAGVESLVVGYGASSVGGYSVVIGTSATMADSNGQGVAIGRLAAGGRESVTIGHGTSGARSSVTIGHGAGTTGVWGDIAIGQGATGGGQSIAIGTGSVAANSSIAIGEQAVSTAANQLVIGGPTTTAINQGYFGNGVTNTAPGSFTLQATGGSGSNVAGGSFTLAGGRGTGSAAGGNIVFQYAPAGGAGSSLNALQTACSISGTNGSFSCPGAGPGSQRFGLNATSAGSDSLALGEGATANGLRGIALGRNTTAGQDSTVVGHAAIAGTSSVAIGNGANATAGDYSVALGDGATTTGNGGIAIGLASVAGTSQLVINGVTSGYFGNGVTNAAPTAFTLQSTGGSAAGTAGAAFTLRGGAGTTTTTGSAGGDLTLQGGNAGGSGNNNGGDVFLAGGTATGSGIRGDLLLQQSGGNVGIGTTPGTNKLLVKQSAQGSSWGLRIVDSASAAGINLYQDGSGNQRLGFEDSFTVGNDSAMARSGTLQAGRDITIKTFNESTFGSIKFDVNGTEIARFDNAGNFGIGDTSPSARLEVGDGTDSLQVSTVGDLTFVDANGAATIQGPAGGALNIISGTSQNLVLNRNGGQLVLTGIACNGQPNGGALTTDASGFVSCSADDGGSTTTLQQAYGNDADGSDAVIALTSADDSILIRNPASGGSDSVYPLHIDQLNTGAFGGMFINSLGTGYALRVDDSSGDTSPFVIEADGDVGIGTASPGFRLQVDQTATNVAGFVVRTAGGTDLAGFAVQDINDTNRYLAFGHNGSSLTLSGANAGAGGFIIKGASSELRLETDNTANDIIFRPGGSTAATIDGATGNFGIGISSPTSLLHVAGTQPVATAVAGTAATAVTTITGAQGGNTTSTAGNTAGAGAAVTINTGGGGNATGATGANTGGAGGNATYSTGAGGTTASTNNSASGGIGGTLTINTGAGGAGTGASGNYFGGSGGSISISAGAGGAVTSGTASAGIGGSISLQGGTGGTGGSSGSGNGGLVTIRGGAGGNAFASGGNLILQGGAKGATGTEGSVVVRPQSDNTQAFLIETAGFASIFAADTTNKLIKVGTGTPTITSAATGGLYVTNQVEIAGRLLVGTTTNGADSNSGQIRYVGTFRNDVVVALRPEFEGAILRGDGSANVGTMISDICSDALNIADGGGAAACDTGQAHSYYEWTTAEASAQDYDVYVRWKVPSDMDISSGFASNISLTMYGWRTDNTNNSLLVNLYNDEGGVCGTADQVVASAAATDWSTLSFAGLAADVDCQETDDASDIRAGEYVTFRFRMNADTGDTIRLGEIEISYKSTF